jgi:CspA family cold shock protein
MPRGKVKWFSTEKGYGFIEQENGEDLFVHHSEVQGSSLREGEAVEFEIGEGRKGPCATKVRSVAE